MCVPTTDTRCDVLDAARLVVDITADVNYSFLVESLKTIRVDDRRLFFLPAVLQTDACVFGAAE